MRRYSRQRLFSYPESGKTALLTAGAGLTLKVWAAFATNRSGGSAAVGFLRKLGDQAWKLGTVTPNFADATVSIQAGGTVSVISTTNGRGFAVQALKPFNLVGLSVTQAATGTPVYVYEYWNGAAWTAMPMLATPVLTTLGDKFFLFAPPGDWALGGGVGEGYDTDKYAIRIRATTAPLTAVQANGAWVATLLDYQEDVPHNGRIAFVGNHKAEHLEAAEEFMPYFGAASAQNLINVEYFEEA